MRTLAPAAAVLAFALAACGTGSEEGPPAPAQPEAPTPSQPPSAEAAGGPSEAAMAEARQIFSTRCFTCHGMEGRGDGPGSAGLSPPPRDFQDPDWQASVDDDHIRNIVLYGGAAVGKSPTMPGNPDLTSRPEVVDALVAHIRSLGAS